jgi:hypothetical protein
MKWMPLAFLSLFVSGTLAACGVAGPAGDGDPGAEVVATRTLVRIAPDGSVTQTVMPITAAEEAQLRASRAAAEADRAARLGTATEALSIDGQCTSSDDLFYDQPVNSGMPFNVLCISGTGTVDLATVCLGVGCTSTWNGAIQSYLAQAEGGHSQGSLGGDCSNFAQSFTQLNGIFGAEFLTLGSSCCPGTKKWCSCGDFSGCEPTCLACQAACNNGFHLCHS